VKRLLTGKEAAEYCGMGVGSFAVHCSVRPKRVRAGQRGLRWDVRDLDKWIDSLSPEGEGLPSSPDEWLERIDATD
jgi:predicted DNA-binding transcriptional regulator AlpA